VPYKCTNVFNYNKYYTKVCNKKDENYNTKRKAIIKSISLHITETETSLPVYFLHIKHDR